MSVSDPLGGYRGLQGRGSVYMESDLRYYNRRIDAERAAAARALTDAARERRMQLVASYIRKLEALTA